MTTNNADTTPSIDQITIDQIILTLQKTLEERKKHTPQDSYVASLHYKGLNKILEKIGEEATEVILAAKDVSNSKQDNLKQSLVQESADLFFHTFVALNHLEIPIQEVFKVLASRFGVSGHTEKAARNITS